MVSRLVLFSKSDSASRNAVINAGAGPAFVTSFDLEIDRQLLLQGLYYIFLLLRSRRRRLVRGKKKKKTPGSGCNRTFDDSSFEL